MQISLNDMIEQLGEDKVKNILSTFTCPQNKDVEYFLKNKAIVFAQRNISKTYLVYWITEDKKEKELVGYFTIAPKVLKISKDALSKTQIKRIKNYGEYDSEQKVYIIPAPLIGQLGKNFTDGNSTIIAGDELLQIAIEKVKYIQQQIGGRYAYLECENKKKLLAFYERNDFVVFGKRKLDKDETNIDGEYLMQLFITT
ncbi:MAG: N-acetyltransferase [Acetivibrio sp.]